MPWEKMAGAVSGSGHEVVAVLGQEHLGLEMVVAVSCSASFVSWGLLDSGNECRKLGRRFPLLCRGFVSLLHSTSTLSIGVTVDLYWGIFIYYP